MGLFSRKRRRLSEIEPPHIPPPPPKDAAAKSCISCPPWLAPYYLDDPAAALRHLIFEKMERNRRPADHDPERFSMIYHLHEQAFAAVRRMKTRVVYYVLEGLGINPAADREYELEVRPIPPQTDSYREPLREVWTLHCLTSASIELVTFMTTCYLTPVHAQDTRAPGFHLQVGVSSHFDIPEELITKD